MDRVFDEICLISKSIFEKIDCNNDLYTSEKKVSIYFI